MRPSFSLFAAAVLESLTFVAGLSPWAKLSAYLKSSDRPFVLTRVFPNQAEFKCVCDGTDNKYFKEITWKENTKTINDILPQFDKRFEKCNEFAESLTKNSQITSRNDADQLFMASLDVESLFTNIPAEETIRICTEDLYGAPRNGLKIGKDDFKQLLQFSMESNYFRFGGQMYQQIDGVSMGSPISPALANAFLVHHEQQWLRNCPDEYKPVFYRRYVDDTFVLFRQPHHLPKFLNYINGCHPNMKFTAEAEANDQLSFLDVMVQRSGSSFTTTVHRKKTATNQMMNYETALPANYKENVVSCLVQRAHRICSNWINFNNCVQSLKSLLRQNGFPGYFCDTVIRRTIDHLQSPKEKDPTVGRKTIQLPIPFLGLRSMQTKLKLVRLCRQLYPQCHLRIIFKPIRRVQQMFSYKDRVPTLLRSNVIYKFQCGSCQATYVGETTRHLGVRASEHTGISAKTQRRLRDPKSSAVFDHCQRTGHQCSLTDFSVVASGSSDYDLRIKESLLIQELKPALNENCSSTELMLF